MGAYLGRRIVLALPVLLGVTFGAFLLVHLVPGDPARVALGSHATEGAVAALRQQLHLDQPLLQQYATFLGDALTFHFGRSIQLHESVAQIVGARVLPTLWLIAYSVVVALAIAVPLAVLAAVRRNGIVDNALRLSMMVTFAMPSFWLGLILILVFGLQLGWFPTSGYGESTLDHVRSLTLPAITIGLWLSPLLMRSLRSSLIETLGSEFVEACRARGMSSRRVLFKHVLRNSLISTVTLLGVSVAFLLSGTVVVENVFGIPGLGSLLVSSVERRDFPVIQGLAVVFGLGVIAVNLLTDIAYATIDPRVRLA
jgi:peptide/nickel transport system permease protein